MVKKFLLSAAVVGALATSAMAYDLYPTNELTKMNAKNNVQASLTSVKASNNKGLIFPAYFAGNGWETTIKVINTKNYPVVAKVVLYDKNDSHEVKDFNIYLSANDVFVGHIKVDSDNQVKIISTDDSAPLPMKNGKYAMASDENPMTQAITSNNGYIEVIPMVMFNANAGKDVHGETLRTAYVKNFINTARNVNGKPLFENGVVKGASYPYVDLKAAGADVAIDVDGDGKNDGNFQAVAGGELDGYVRITDTINGKDMIHKPVYVTYDDNNAKTDDALVYLEGEKANLADVTIDSANKKYDLTKFPMPSTKSVYITFGEAPVNDMYALFTFPFKRVEVQQTLRNNPNATNSNNFEGIKLNKDKTDVESYGFVKLRAYIYDNNENLASSALFSPYSTPTIKLENELSTTGYDPNDDNSLAHYITQSGFNEGYAEIENATNSIYNNAKAPQGVIPGIVTQMIATQAGGKVVTNWFDPITR